MNTAKIDQFMRDCGVKRMEGEKAERPSFLQMQLMATHAEYFLRGGGRISWRQWRKLSRWSRVAFKNAGDVINRERAVWAGLASAGPKAAAEILSPADGGDLKESIALDEMANSIAEAMKKGFKP